MRSPTSRGPAARWPWSPKLAHSPSSSRYSRIPLNSSVLGDAAPRRSPHRAHQPTSSMAAGSSASMAMARFSKSDIWSSRLWATGWSDSWSPASGSVDGCTEVADDHGEVLPTRVELGDETLDGCIGVEQDSPEGLGRHRPPPGCIPSSLIRSRSKEFRLPAPRASATSSSVASSSSSSSRYGAIGEVPSIAVVAPPPHAGRRTASTTSLQAGRAPRCRSFAIGISSTLCIRAHSRWRDCPVSLVTADEASTGAGTPTRRLAVVARPRSDDAIRPGSANARRGSPRWHSLGPAPPSAAYRRADPGLRGPGPGARRAA